MAFSARPCENFDEWDEFVRASPDGSIFNLSVYLRQFDALAFEPWIVSEGGKALLGLVFVKNADGTVRDRGYPWVRPELLRGADAAAGPRHSRVKENLEAFEALLAGLSERYDTIRLRTAPGVDDVRALLWFNHDTPGAGQFRVMVRYTGLIELSSAPTFDDYLARVRPARRRQNRLAAKAGLMVERSTDIEVLDYLHRLTFERQAIERDRLEVSLLRRIAAAAVEHDFGDIYVARLPGGEPASATLFLRDARRGHYLAGANHPAHRSTYSGTLCFTESLRGCHERSLSEVDVCGINSPNRGDFKVSYDAEPRPYFDAVWQRAAAR